MTAHTTTHTIYVKRVQNPLQYCKVISLQLIKINEKKKKRKSSLKKKRVCQHFPGGTVDPPANEGTRVQPLILEDSTSHRATHHAPQLPSPRAANIGAQVPRACAPQRGNHHNEEHVHRNLRRPKRSNRDPVQPRIKR